MKVSNLDVLSLGGSGGVPEGDGDHGDNIRLKANMISFVVTVWSPLSPSGPRARARREKRRAYARWIGSRLHAFSLLSVSPARTNH
jgi:hypothetical protein